VRAKVVQKFIDKHTNEVRNVGDEFTCTKKRFNEILSVGEFVVEIKEDKAD
jgi:hypothetical protein